MPDLTHAKISFRVFVQYWRDPVQRHRMLASMQAFRDTISEVALFTSFTHPPLPLETIQTYAREMREILPEFRALGLRAGINHLSTIGHLNENLANSLNAPWQRIMDLHGVVEEGNYCPNDGQLRGYVRDSYIALAEAGPDFIWVDDDVRLQGHGKVQQGCFCDTCLAIFGAEMSRTWTREQLRDAFNAEPISDRLALRMQWLSHNRRTMRELLAHIRAAVDYVDPSIPVGLMTGENYYSGFAYDEWARALSGARNVTVMWRPGGGFYTDETPRGLLDKAHSIGRQIAGLPAAMTDIQSEIENFPYQRLKKAASTLALEVLADIGAGCTGTALNVSGGGGAEPAQEYEPYFATVRDVQPLLDRAVATFGRSRSEGIWQALDRDEYATVSLDGDWSSAPGWHGPGAFAEIAESGLPIAYEHGSAAVSLLSGDSVLAFSRDELHTLLGGGVLLDGPALKRLTAMGFAEEIGFDLAGMREDDTIEVLTDDPLNGQFAGAQRDCRQSFKGWSEPAYLLHPLAADARVSSIGVDYGDVPLGTLGGYYENRLGGRVAVCGYFPWRFVQTYAKTAQLKALTRWLSRDTLPAYIASYHKITLWARRDANNHPALLLINTSFDPAADARLLIRHACEMQVTTMDGRIESLPAAGMDGPYTVFTLPLLPPWKAVLVSAE